MTRTTSYLLKSLAAVAAVLAFSNSGSASIVFDNSSGWLSDTTPRIYNATNGVEFGDQVTLQGSDRVLSDLKLDYFLSAAASGNETVLITLYANDGLELSPGVFAPGTVLGTATGALSTSAFGYNTLTYTASTLTTLPDSFTYTVTFGGIDAGEQAGLLVSNPATVGTSFTDFWLKSGGTWNTYLLDNGATAANFSARITAVPEPTTLALGLLAGLGCLGYLGYKRRTE